MSDPMEQTRRFKPKEKTLDARRWSGWAAAAILAVFVYAGIASAEFKAPTFDEGVHILGGYMLLTRGDNHINPENGAVPQAWAAIPLALNPKIIPPDVKSRGWRAGLNWNAASNFLYSSGNDSDAILRSSRAMALLLTAACGFLVFIISRRIWGIRAGLFSLALFALSPTMMANGRLVTSDVACAFFFLLSMWTWRLATERLTLMRAAAFCAGMCGLFLSKLSAPLVLPAILAVLAIRLFRRRPLRIRLGSAEFEVAGQLKQAAVLAAVVLLAGAAVFAAIWASASFRYSMLTDESLRPMQSRKWALMTEKPDFPIKVVLAVRETRILPEYYLYGLAHVLHESKRRHAFLEGRRSDTGWWWFFPATFAMKTPPELILFILAGLVLPFLVVGAGKGGGGKGECSMLNAQSSILNEEDKGNRGAARRKALAAKLAFAQAFVGVYLLFSLTTNLNIGHRHLLPILPFLFIIAGGTVFSIRRYELKSRRKAVAARFAAAALLAGLLLQNILIFPDYLAYFSPIFGGPAEGYRHLVDSSLDWGQDLKRVKSYAEREKAAGRECYFAYFGSVNLTAYKLPAKRLLCAFEQFSYDVFPLRAGSYCLSATMLQMVYYPDLAEWNPELEGLFREYRGRFRKFRRELARPKGKRNQATLNAFFRDYKVFEKLRFAKLAAALRKRGPDDYIGYSVLIYKLSKKQLDGIMDEDCRNER